MSRLRFFLGFIRVPPAVIVNFLCFFDSDSGLNRSVSTPLGMMEMFALGKVLRARSLSQRLLAMMLEACCQASLVMGL